MAMKEKTENNNLTGENLARFREPN